MGYVYDVWRLAVYGVRQAIWNKILPNDSRAVSDDKTKDEWLFALDVCGLQCFGDILKIYVLECSLSCCSEPYPLSYGSE